MSELGRALLEFGRLSLWLEAIVADDLEVEQLIVPCGSACVVVHDPAVILVAARAWSDDADVGIAVGQLPNNDIAELVILWCACGLEHSGVALEVTAEVLHAAVIDVAVGCVLAPKLWVKMIVLLHVLVDKLLEINA